MTETRRLLGVMVALSAIAIVFAAGIIVAAVVQKDDGSGAMHPLVARVSDALGFESDPEDEVAAGSLTSVEELREQYVSSLIEEGEIGEDEADEFGEWLEDAPETFRSRSSTDQDGSRSLGEIPFERFRSGSESEDLGDWLDDLLEGVWMEEESESDSDIRPFVERREFEKRFESFDDSPFGWFGLEGGDHNEWLEQLVEHGTLSEEDADKLKSWLGGLSGSFGEGFGGKPGAREFEFDSDDGRFRFRGEWRWDETEEDEPSHSSDEDNGDA